MWTYDEVFMPDNENPNNNNDKSKTPSDGETQKIDKAPSSDNKPKFPENTISHGDSDLPTIIADVAEFER
jgi:hypothetical protein